MSDDAMKALDEIEAAFKRVTRLATYGTPGESEAEDLDEAGRVAERALSLLPTLRAALVPPADDEVEAIRLRAAATGGADPEYVSMLFGQKIADAFADRATLLRALAAERAVNAVPELLALREERDKAQRACEQMGERITALENLLMLCADQFRVLRRLAEGGQIHRIEAGNKRVRITLSKAVASECEISEAKVRAALNQEPGQ